MDPNKLNISQSNLVGPKRKPRKKEEVERKKYRKHVHYQVDNSLSPIQNVLEVAKRAFPNELAIEKLQDPVAFQSKLSQRKIVLRSVAFCPTKKDTWRRRHIDEASYGLEAITITAKLPDSSRARWDKYKNWSIKVEENGKLSITRLQDIYKELRSILKVEEDRQEEIKKVEEHDKEEADRVRSFINQNGIDHTKRVYLYQRKRTDKDGATAYFYDLNIGNLTEEEIKNLSIYIQRVLGGSK